MTDLVSVQNDAIHSLPYAAIYVALSAFAFQLDGIFIGTSRTREMRNASLLSAALFIGSSSLLVPQYGIRALWLTFIAYVIIRSFTLAISYPALRQDIDQP